MSCTRRPPTGQKIMIMFEETRLEWKRLDVHICLGEQFSPQYLKLSPQQDLGHHRQRRGRAAGSGQGCQRIRPTHYRNPPPA